LGLPSAYRHSPGHGRFMLAFPAELPSDALDRLASFGEESFAEAGAHAGILALWRRASNAPHDVLALRKIQRRRACALGVRVEGSFVVPARRHFTLKGRADRIDFFAMARARSSITRRPSSTSSQMEEFVTPQLPLKPPCSWQARLASLRHRRCAN